MAWRTVGTVDELLGALRDGAQKIELTTTLSGLGSITLPPGVSLRGGGLEFGAKGLRLSSDNTVENLSVTVPEHEIAIYNDVSVKDLGTLTLRGITTRGQIYLQASDNVRSGTVHAKDIHVAAADTRDRFDRPTGFGVEALQGAFTLWNRQPDTAVVLHARLENISAGSVGQPVRGSGVFVGGHMDDAGKPDGGTVAVDLLSTGEVHSDGGIAPGTPDLISGGVFVIAGAEVEEVQNLGSTTTYGPNDMVLDNWGRVQRWNATGPGDLARPQRHRIRELRGHRLAERRCGHRNPRAGCPRIQRVRRIAAARILQVHRHLRRRSRGRTDQQGAGRS